MSQAPVNVIFGAMLFGGEGAEGARTHSFEDCTKIPDVFQSHGHYEIDTSRICTGGQSEQFLGELNWQSRGLIMGTKLYPTAIGDYSWLIEEKYSLSATDVRLSLERSLKTLKTEKISTFYLHAPDRKTPIEETLRAVNTLYEEGKFERFGLSNFQAWEVARICEIATQHGWVRPVVYQGIYSALQRLVEAEVIPCLRHYNISFYAYSPLNMGMLTGKYTRGQNEFEQGSRFDPDRTFGAFQQANFFTTPLFDAIDTMKVAAEQHGLTLAECSLRWLAHHSALKKGLGDGVIIRASKVQYLEANLCDIEKGPLPGEVVKAFEQGWAQAKGAAKPYWH